MAGTETLRITVCSLGRLGVGRAKGERVNPPFSPNAATVTAAQSAAEVLLETDGLDFAAIFIDSGSPFETTLVESPPHSAALSYARIPGLSRSTRVGAREACSFGALLHRCRALSQSAAEGACSAVAFLG